MWQETTHLTRLIDAHRIRYPQMQARDVYKLLFQGILGPEHLIASAEVFEKFLQAELEQIEPDLGQTLWEAVRPDETLFRLNLRPFLAQAGQTSRLVAACLETARQRWGTHEELLGAWALFTRLCQEGRWPDFPLPEVLALTTLLEQHNYPAVHHSAIYEQAYRPAYRLVSGVLRKGLLQLK